MTAHTICPNASNQPLETPAAKNKLPDQALSRPVGRAKRADEVRAKTDQSSPAPTSQGQGGIRATSPAVIWQAIETYYTAGLSCMPADRASKKPVVSTWKQMQEHRLKPVQLRKLAWGKGDAVAVVAGKISGDLEVLDFDQGARAFDEWRKLVDDEAVGLVERLTIQTTQSGGKHVIYRCDQIAGNTKLATDAGGKVLIETRGEGGYFLAAPSAGYSIAQGSLEQIARITPKERGILWSMALSLSVGTPQIVTKSLVKRGEEATGRPGDAFNQRGPEVVAPLLEEAGWSLFRQLKGSSQWTRPGKNGGCSATLFDTGVFYPFTTNAPPLEDQHPYSPFDLYATLKHAGDFSAAARQLREEGYGDQDGRRSSAKRTGKGKSKKKEGDKRTPAEELEPALEAQYLLATKKSTSGVRTLHAWRGEFWEWRGGAYRQVEKDMLRSELWENLSNDYEGIHTSHVNNVTDALRGFAALSGDLSPPVWLAEESPPFPLDESLVTRQGIFHLPSLCQEKEGAQIPNTPNLFATSAIDVRHDPQAPQPRRWLQFLNELFEDDPRAIEQLQMWFGYCLTSDTSQQKMLLIVGPKRSGKGTLCSVLSDLIGRENVASQTGSGLATPFGLWPLYGKSLCILPDARFGGRADQQQIVVERLLSISGEDPLPVERKFLKTIVTKLTTKLLVTTNETPALRESSGALIGRMIVLQLRRSFFGREDRYLKNALRKELPGILNWAIAGWGMLAERGRFTQPDSALELLSHAAELAAPVKTFVNDCCQLRPECWTDSGALFEEWKKWGTRRGRKPGVMEKFGRDLAAAFPELKRKQRRCGGKQKWGYEGIALQAEAAATGDDNR